jgi:uncharacterized protein involved in exopolysaccharide biosynthesis
VNIEVLQFRSRLMNEYPQRFVQNGVGHIVRGTALLLAGVCFLFAGVCNTFGPIRYRATARVKVNPPAVAAGLGTSPVASPYNPAHVKKEMERIISPELLRQVAAKLYREIQQDDWPKDSGWRAFVLGRPRNLGVSPVVNTSFVEVSAAHHDPTVAAKIANTVVQIYRTQAYSPPADPREISDPAVQIMDPAVAPAVPVFPDPVLAVGAVFLGAVLLTVGVCRFGKSAAGIRHKAHSSFRVVKLGFIKLNR